jgi:hypothetical protein
MEKRGDICSSKRITKGTPIIKKILKQIHIEISTSPFLA